MIDINAMRAKVAKMGPSPQGMAELRQFAQKYHDNVIAMSLVSSRLTDIERAKQMDEAKKVPAEPNTVIDQVAQSIPMEESGIAGLPVNNITMAANGGIVGYAGDGPKGQLVKDTTFPEGSLLGMYERWQSQNPGLPLAAMFSNAPEYQKMRDALKQRGINPEEGDKGARDIAGSKLAANTSSDAQRQTDSTRPGVVEPAVVKREPASPAREPAASAAASAAPAARSVEGPTTQGVIDQFKAFQDSIGSPTSEGIVNEQKAANALAKKAAEDSKAATEKYWQGRGDTFKGKDERLAAREAALEKTKSSIEGMAWIQAGLETMATSGSLGQAIAAGGKKGMESYGSGIKNYTDSKEKLDEARDKLDDLRTGYKDMSEKEILAATREINNVVVNSSQAMVTLLREQAKNGDQKAVDLLKVFDEQNKRAHEARLKQAELDQRERHYQNPKNTDTERLMQRVLDLRAQGKIKEADDLIKTFQDFKGISQRADTAADRIDAKKQEALASDPIYKRALRVLADPNATQEAKTKAERDRLTSLQAAGLQSGATMAPNVPPPDAVREIKK
jgi:hypothetical protein